LYVLDNLAKCQCHLCFMLFFCSECLFNSLICDSESH
jgi:hypothetical protein